MSIVKRGVSGMVRRKYRAMAAGMQPRPIRIRQDWSMLLRRRHVVKVVESTETGVCNIVELQGRLRSMGVSRLGENRLWYIDTIIIATIVAAIRDEISLYTFKEKPEGNLTQWSPALIGKNICEHRATLS